MSSFGEKVNILLKRNKFLAYGAPFLVVVACGPLLLEKFNRMRYKYRKITEVSQEEMAAMGIKMKKNEEITLESEYEKIKQMDIDNWQQVRGPRPWEDNFLENPGPKIKKPT